ncbi:MAG: serine/threonine protein kinase, partial [Planctomycetes bacterium]|nr:serine/threonine protein kinase [Planctomycetota bacterium]
MSAARHARRKALFLDALDRPAGEREAFVRGAAADDTTLIDEVLQMLASETERPDFLGTSPVADLIAGAAAPEVLGKLGEFTVLRRLGEGSMGAVYEAEQQRPRRRVALKVLHPGFVTPQQLRRFEFESEVLGRLEHPGIARIFQAGTSDVGRGTQPWFAMELVDGQPLTDWCRNRDLPLAARLELLAKVADAVQHAHQRGVVHRDLKPANVLVGDDGRPKVLDFGIARTADAELQSQTLQTHAGTIVGTLQYMSPEQAAANPDAIDVRTDVYSLGVMLYELVADRPPLELSRLPLHSAVRKVLEDEPVPLRHAP